VLEPSAFFPATPQEREGALGTHHMSRSWHNVTAMRNAMLQAERRLETTRKELAKEKRAHAATKKRLAKAEGRSAGDDAGKQGLRAKLGMLRGSG
jgi:hypothetical protein